MANEREHGVSYKIYDKGSLGQVHIADEVIAVIAGIATMEVEGVASMAGTAKDIQKEIISKLGMKVLSKGVGIKVENDQVEANISVVLSYGKSIPEVTKAIQEKVSTEIENMTGMTVAAVNVDVVDVNLENE
jgi:uncharacterized alkaline shock family protein YloU